MTASPIPAYVNARSGSADAARSAVEADPRFALHALEPARIDDALRAAVARSEPRVVVAGGDGTLTGAARVLAGTPTALADTLTRLGWTVEVGEPNARGTQLDVVVTEV